MAIVKEKISKLDVILKEAAKLFRQKGFGGTSMRDLAETGWYGSGEHVLSYWLKR